jgi:hypothetical protein
MSDKTKSITKDSSGSTGLLCTAALFAWAGILLAFSLLVSTPLKRFTSVKDRDVFLEQNAGAGIKPGELYYFEGPVARGREWQQKLDVFLNGTDTVLEVTAAQVNACLASMLRPPSQPPAGASSTIMIVPKMPNLFVDENEGIFFSLPTEVSIFGSQHKLVVCARGHFSPGSEVTFTMEALYLNNAGIPVMGGLADRVVATVLQGYLQSAEFIALRQAWAQVESAELVADTIRLKLR